MTALDALGYPNRARRHRPADTCPVGACPHPLVFHDVDEVPWPRIERCTVADCGCSGLFRAGREPGGGVSAPFFETWRDLALCRQVDPDLMYPIEGGSARPAKLVCARCPVRTACLDYAMRYDLNFGVWGGLTPRERRALLRVRPAARPGREAA